MEDGKQYWFRAKKYGFGWGLPLCWQGWFVFIGYFVLILGAIPFIEHGIGIIAYQIYVLVLTVVLVVIGYLKGEKPSWRWGNRRQ